MSGSSKPTILGTKKFKVLSVDASETGRLETTTTEAAATTSTTTILRPQPLLSADPHLVPQHYVALVDDPLGLRLADCIGAQWEGETRHTHSANPYITTDTTTIEAATSASAASHVAIPSRSTVVDTKASDIQSSTASGGGGRPEPSKTRVVVVASSFAGVQSTTTSQNSGIVRDALHGGFFFISGGNGNGSSGDGMITTASKSKVMSSTTTAKFAVWSEQGSSTEASGRTSTSTTKISMPSSNRDGPIFPPTLLSASASENATQGWKHDILAVSFQTRTPLTFMLPAAVSAATAMIPPLDGGGTGTIVKQPVALLSDEVSSAVVVPETVVHNRGLYNLHTVQPADSEEIQETGKSEEDDHGFEVVTVQRASMEVTALLSTQDESEPADLADDQHETQAVMRDDTVTQEGAMLHSNEEIVIEFVKDEEYAATAAAAAAAASVVEFANDEVEESATIPVETPTIEIAIVTVNDDTAANTTTLVEKEEATLNVDQAVEDTPAETPIENNEGDDAAHQATDTVTMSSSNGAMNPDPEGDTADKAAKESIVEQVLEIDRVSEDAELGQMSRDIRLQENVGASSIVSDMGDTVLAPVDDDMPVAMESASAMDREVVSAPDALTPVLEMPASDTTESVPVGAELESETTTKQPDVVHSEAVRDAARHSDAVEAVDSENVNPQSSDGVEVIPDPSAAPLLSTEEPSADEKVSDPDTTMDDFVVVEASDAVEELAETNEDARHLAVDTSNVVDETVRDKADTGLNQVSDAIDVEPNNALEKDLLAQQGLGSSNVADSESNVLQMQPPSDTPASDHVDIPDNDESPTEAVEATETVLIEDNVTGTVDEEQVADESSNAAALIQTLPPVDVKTDTEAIDEVAQAADPMDLIPRDLMADDNDASVEPKETLASSSEGLLQGEAPVVALDVGKAETVQATIEGHEDSNGRAAEEATLVGTTNAVESMISSSLSGSVGGAAKLTAKAPVAPVISYADMARKSSEKGQASATSNVANRAKASSSDAMSKSDPARKPIASPMRTTRFIPSLGGVVRMENKSVASSVTETSSDRSAQKGSSSDMSELSASVVVLISNQSLKREVTVQQQKLLSTLDALGVQYRTVDGADAANKDERNNLFEVSGLRAVYPQIFVASGAEPTFWGGYDRFEASNDDGALASDLGVQSSGVKSTVENVPSAVERIASTASPDAMEGSAESGTVLVLVSNQSLKREVTVQQQKLLSTLEARGVPYKTVDGADAANKDERNRLFEVSCLRGTYPQVFLSKGAVTTFWGGYDRFETSNDDGTLASDLGVQLVGTVSVATVPDVTGIDAVVTTATKASLIVLVSNQSLDREVVANQQRAFTVLTANGIQYETIDGADPMNKDVRNNLFEVSGIRAKYPQFFTVKNAEMEFWGEWERFELCNEGGSLAAELGGSNLEQTQSTAPISTTERTTTEVTSAEISTESVRDAAPAAVRGSKSRNIAEPALKESEASGETVAASPTVSTPMEAPSATAVEKSEDKSVADTEASVAAAVANRTAAAPAAVQEAKSKSTQRKGKGTGEVASSTTKSPAIEISKQEETTEITIYGATSFVAKHAIEYLMNVSLSLPGKRTVTLAGRNKSKLDSMQASLSKLMSTLPAAKSKSNGSCVFDVLVADCDNASGLLAMAQRTKLVISFAGPFEKYGDNVVAACAQSGVDYVDITGEIHWAGLMRAKYGTLAEKSGSRIISFCGFDSVPSDIAVYAAVVALRRATRSNTEVESATCWHSSAGLPNGGTIQTVVDMPLNLGLCFSQPTPFLLDDPLVLAHPTTHSDSNYQKVKSRMAKAEWLNQLPSFDSIMSYGASASFFMAPINAKIVHASSIALRYGQNFVYRERFLPLGIKMTKKLGALSIIPALFVQFGLLLGVSILKTPVIGRLVANLLFPAGSGASDSSCKNGFAEVYSEVTSAPGTNGKVSKANCSMKFEGDPGNFVTAQCVIESALSLVLEKDKLPARSADGFGTPAELLGPVLLNRLQKSSVRPVKIVTNARKNVNRTETAIFC